MPTPCLPVDQNGHLRLSEADCRVANRRNPITASSVSAQRASPRGETLNQFPGGRALGSGFAGLVGSFTGPHRP